MKIGIIGFGVVGKIRYEHICKNNRYKVLGICDNRIKKKYTYNKINFYNSIYRRLQLVTTSELATLIVFPNIDLLTSVSCFQRIKNYCK